MNSNTTVSSTQQCNHLINKFAWIKLEQEQV